MKASRFSYTTLFAALITACFQVDAAVVNITQGSTTGYTMTDGNTYVVQNSVTFSSSTAGESGMSVADNATVVLYIPAGVTLTAIGANGSGRTGGGAGIRVPVGATLVITGEGSVVVNGGDASYGGNGGSGGAGSAYINSENDLGGTGGRGGIGRSGGAGAGAGIGGCSKSEMGVCYILGSINVSATGGNRGPDRSSGRAGNYALARIKRTDGVAGYWCCAAGGGGGGGAGGRGGAGSSIGGGGGDGKSGASGEQGRVSLFRFVDRGDTPPSFLKEYNGDEGRSGTDGSNGNENSGTLYVATTASVNVSREKESASTHPSAQYMIEFDLNGGQMSTANEPLTVTLGCELPSRIPMPQNSGCVFMGWAEDKLGTKMWWSASLDPYSPVYTSPSNTVLYALWKLLPPSFVPEDGTIFDNSLSVAISCPAEGATIHYTTDGSEPTVESPVYRRFRINKRTTVKAIAEENGLLSEIVTAEYALGQCADPVITPGDGSTFEWSGERVAINWQGADGVLRYTTDGSDPTAVSPIYEGPFTIGDTTVVKAKAFGDQFFDSSVVTASITRVWTDVAMPQIEVASSFTGSKTKIVISCATEGADIHYTLDGTEPNSSSAKYVGPFYVTDSCSVKAYAVKYDYRNSAVATREISKVWGIGDTLGKPDHRFTTDGNGGVGWIGIDDATAPNGKAMRSGLITHNQSSVLSTTVTGPGTLAFSWRTSCEDSGGQYDWDHAEFAVDGTVLLQRDGINSWTGESVRVNGDGEHTVTWTYKKDDVESDGDDAAYVAGYGWTSDYTETKTTDVSVPYAWLLQHDSEIVDEFDAYEAAAKAMAANGQNKVWECFVAGISPTNETARFTTKIEMKDGVPIVTWEPDLNTNGILRLYKVYGSETLESGGDWQYPTNSLHRFFRVTVEMP